MRKKTKELKTPFFRTLKICVKRLTLTNHNHMQCVYDYKISVYRIVIIFADFFAYFTMFLYIR